MGEARIDQIWSVGGLRLPGPDDAIEFLLGRVYLVRTDSPDPVNDDIRSLIKGIADKEKISLVVEKGDNGAGALVIYSNPSLDLTDRVIKELDKAAK